MSFSVFFYAFLAPKEGSYQYESRTELSSRMSVSFYNEKPKKNHSETISF